MKVILRRLLKTSVALGCLVGCAAEVAENEIDSASDEVLGSTQALSTASFTDTHLNATWNWWGYTCNTPRSLSGREPTDPGTYPVFVYFVGWGGNYQAADATLAVMAMAPKGYVAASVEYSNGDMFAIDEKARCAFDTSSSSSALAKLCSRPKADCSKGIVVMGHSLGGGVAVRSRNHNTNVRAVVTMGTSAGAEFTPANRALPQDRLLAFAGQDDSANSPSNLNSITGLNCTSGTECKANPSATMPTAGWYQVQNSQTGDGSADHCYSLNGGCSGTSVDSVWLGASPAGLLSMLNWLDGFVTH